MANQDRPRGAEPKGKPLRQNAYVAAEQIYKGDLLKKDASGKVARAAASRLRRFEHKFYTFCTLATPHLGAIHQKTFIKFGMWFMKVFKSADCIYQLQFKDNDNFQSTFFP